MWHTLTNHPAHQKKDGDASKSDPKPSEKNDKPKDEEPKKSSGSGSG